MSPNRDEKKYKKYLKAPPSRWTNPFPPPKDAIFSTVSPTLVQEVRVQSIRKADAVGTEEALIPKGIGKNSGALLKEILMWCFFL